MRTPWADSMRSDPLPLPGIRLSPPAPRSWTAGCIGSEHISCHSSFMWKEVSVKAAWLPRAMWCLSYHINLPHTANQTFTSNIVLRISDIYVIDTDVQMLYQSIGFLLLLLCLLILFQVFDRLCVVLSCIVFDKLPQATVLEMQQITINHK